MHVSYCSKGGLSASVSKLLELDLSHNTLTGAGSDITRIMKLAPLCKEIHLNHGGMNDEDFHAIVNALTCTHHTSDEKFAKRCKKDSAGVGSHIENLYLQYNRFTHVETMMLLLDNLPSSLHVLHLHGNQFNQEETQKIKSSDTYKHLDLIL